MTTPHPGWLDDAAGHRARLVSALVENGTLRTPGVHQAFADVPRELFVPGEALRAGVGAVYANEVLVTAMDATGTPISSSSQPQLMAAMLENLDVHQGMSVLEIGTGTGYNAALLRHLVGDRGRVVSVEVEGGIAARAQEALRLGGYEVDVVVGDGAAGHREGAPYDRIISTASAETVPLEWVDQLGSGGLLEVPLRLNGGETQAVATLRRAPGGLVSTGLLSGRFMPLRGSATPRPDTVLDVPVTADATVRLAGASVGRLTPGARERLVAGLGSGRRRALGFRARTWDLVMFVSLEVPAGALVSRWPELSVGVLTGDGGLSLVVGSRVEGSAVRDQELVSFGPTAAEERLIEVIRRWEGLQRPRMRDLVVEWSQDSREVRHHWVPPRSAYSDH